MSRKIPDLGPLERMDLYRNLGHRAPLTRRELLARSALGVSAAALVPSVLGSLLRAERGPTDGPALPAFLVFDLSGGAALPGNFLVGKAEHPEDSLLAAYDVLGWDPRASGALDSSFGLPMAKVASQMLVGLRQTASAEALAKLRFGGFCHISQDDSTVNRSSALGLIGAAGVVGSVIDSGVGLSDAPSGGNSDLALPDPTRKPLEIQSLRDFLDAVSYGPALSDLPQRSVAALANAAQKLSAEQGARLAKMNRGAQLRTLADAAYLKNLAYASGPVSGIDPRTDAVFKAVYGIDEGTDVADPEAIFAGVVMNVLRGNCGPGALTIGGCDYHTGSQTEGDAKDLQIGQELGRAVEAAHRLGRALFLQILTDGGLSADSGTRNWSGDAGDKSMTVAAYYDPAGAPAQPRVQVGAFTDGQSADRSTAIGSDPSLAAYAVVANYLNVAGKLGSFDDVVPGRPFPPDVLNTLLVFG